jgi:hypothetical protein
MAGPTYGIDALALAFAAILAAAIVTLHRRTNMAARKRATGPR